MATLLDLLRRLTARLRRQPPLVDALTLRRAEADEASASMHDRQAAGAAAARAVASLSEKDRPTAR